MFASFVIIIGIAICGFTVATFSSAMTVTQPETIFLAEERGMQPVPVGSIGEAVALLKGGQVDAVVHDTPLLRYYLKNNPDSRLTLAPQTFEIFTYGITYPGGQPMAGKTRSSAGKDTGGRDIRRDACQVVWGMK